MSSKSLVDPIESGQERPEPEDGGFVRPQLGLRHILYLILYCALAFWVTRLGIAPVLIALLVVLVPTIVAVVIIVARRRATRQDALVAILAVAAERKLPLPAALDAISDQFTGEYRRKVRTLAHYLKAGVSLPDALDREPRTLPSETEILARVGSEVGTLAGALREAGATRLGLRPVWRGIAGRIGYFLYVLYVMQVISGFLFYYTLPKYEAILSDFGISLPPPTAFVMRIGYSVQRWWVLYGLLMLCESVAMLALFASVTGWSRLRIPGLDRLLVRRHTALILRSLAWVVEGDAPITHGLRLLVNWYPSYWVRKRLRLVILDVEHGSDWVDSMTHHGLLRGADAAVLAAASRAGNLAWALRETALGGERRLAFRLQVILQLLTPVVLIVLGLLVGLICVAYFAPLIKILEVLA